MKRRHDLATALLHSWGSEVRTNVPFAVGRYPRIATYPRPGIVTAALDVEPGWSSDGRGLEADAARNEISGVLLTVDDTDHAAAAVVG
jgi:hypothetical protein